MGVAKHEFLWLKGQWWTGELPKLLFSSTCGVFLLRTRLVICKTIRSHISHLSMSFYSYPILFIIIYSIVCLSVTWSDIISHILQHSPTISPSNSMTSPAFCCSRWRSVRPKTPSIASPPGHKSLRRGSVLVTRKDRINKIPLAFIVMNCFFDLFWPFWIFCWGLVWSNLAGIFLGGCEQLRNLEKRYNLDAWKWCYLGKFSVYPFGVHGLAHSYRWSIWDDVDHPTVESGIGFH